ncbi:hypothetical protein [Leekyejoonella antrihumi]|uniref:Uncharacterized protein n=1 Tax=Leekyejoonella antrihumi TaxID=1660198 RepID=A0A563E077_9MICO|nr:hypothetical protein [Leekyejoonella antrihumi]TWP35917.1 hypothetical protein FGL98_11830 [Leekyejoonella antrihumi]
MTGRVAMGWSAKTGRPSNIPRDLTDLNGPAIDPKPRVLWLLRMTRMASPLGEVKEFCAQATALGHPLGSDTLSSIENGRRAMSAEVITTYERVLHKRPGDLLGPSDALWRTFGSIGLRHTSHTTRDATWTELERLEGRFQDNQMTGGDWLSFSNLVDMRDGLMLFPSVQEEWSDRLVTEMMRSVGAAYIARCEAISRLLHDPQPRRAIIQAVRVATHEDGAQGTIDAVAALGDAPRASALDEVLRIFSTTTGGPRTGAALALQQWADLGEFDTADRDRITRHLVAVAHDDPTEGGEAAMVVAPYISSQLTTALLRRSGAEGRVAALPTRMRRPPRIGQYLSAAANYSGISTDPMLERLLQEALAHEHDGRGHHALVLLGASPYREPIAETALDIFASAEPPARKAAGHMLTYLAGPQHQQALTALLHDPELSVQAFALQALAHSSGVPADIDLHEHLIHPSLASATIYAAGMSGHPDLASAVGSRFVRGDVQQSAKWWMAHGTRVDDAPA